MLPLLKINNKHQIKTHLKLIEQGAILHSKYAKIYKKHRINHIILSIHKVLLGFLYLF